MSEKFLNILILVFFLLTVGGYFVISGNLIVDKEVMKLFRYIYMIPFGITPLLLIIKIVSRIFLIGLKDRPVSSIENLYAIYYFLLTKEAKKEWVNYIKEQKRNSI